jgi:hypothetical protein
MRKREPDPGGDYGYDLVHEAVGNSRPPVPTGGAEGEGRAERAERADEVGDYGYDEAHDF